MDFDLTQVRPLILLAAVAGGLTLLAWAAAELLAETSRVEAAAGRVDVAAQQVWLLLREASDITRTAAGELP